MLKHIYISQSIAEKLLKGIFPNEDLKQLQDLYQDSNNC
jgi:hypothetical protein